jgi:hypothetical protein
MDAPDDESDHEADVTTSPSTLRFTCQPMSELEVDFSLLPVPFLDFGLDSILFFF